MINEFIKKMREKRKYSQESIARVLDISRQSYALLESGKNKITLEQVEILSNFYDISKIDFITEQENSITAITTETSNDILEKDIRINIPKNNIEKFKQVLLYILPKIGAKPNIGQVALYKILYFIDFDFYEKYEEQLIGAIYIKNKFGPTPVDFAKIIEQMKRDGEIEEVKSKYFNKDQTKYLPLKECNLKYFNGEEIKHIDKELERLSEKNGSELSEFSHRDTPWIATKMGMPIEYELVFYRGDDTSFTRYSGEKNDF